MKYLNLVLIFGFIVASSASVEATVTKKKTTVSKAKASKNKKASKISKPKSTVAVDRTRGELKTNVSFDDTVLHGQYQMPEEGLAKVETEKVLSDILGVRRHFKDRLSEASQQE